MTTCHDNGKARHCRLQFRVKHTECMTITTTTAEYHSKLTVDSMDRTTGQIRKFKGPPPALLFFGVAQRESRDLLEGHDVKRVVDVDVISIPMKNTTYHCLQKGPQASPISSSACVTSELRLTIDIFCPFSKILSLSEQKQLLLSCSDSPHRSLKWLLSRNRRPCVCAFLASLSVVPDYCQIKSNVWIRPAWPPLLPPEEQKHQAKQPARPFRRWLNQRAEPPNVPIPTSFPFPPPPSSP